MKNNTIETKIMILSDRKQQVVKALEVFKAIGYSKDYLTTWINAINNNPAFVEGRDYLVRLIDNDSAISMKTHFLTLRMAQHLALMAHTSKGHDYREKLLDMEEKLIAKYQKIAEQGVKVSHYTIRNYIDEHTCLKQMPSTQKIAFKVHSYCQKHGLEVRTQPSQRYGSINLYPIEVLEAYFELVI